MKLLVAIVGERDRKKVSEALVLAGNKFTILHSTGGFLREPNLTFLIGCGEDEVEGVYDVLRENCRSREQYMNIMPPDVAGVGTILPSPVKITVGGAVVFVLDVEQWQSF
jgi:uncharacterized protein YaaQ